MPERFTEAIRTYTAQPWSGIQAAMIRTIMKTLSLVGRASVPRIDSEETLKLLVRGGIGDLTGIFECRSKVEMSGSPQVRNVRLRSGYGFPVGASARALALRTRFFSRSVFFLVKNSLSRLR